MPCVSLLPDQTVLSFTSQRKELRSHFKFSSQDWILGPKQVNGDAEEGGAEIEEERRPSVSSQLTERDGLKMETERDDLLPGFHRPSVCPSSPAPLRSTFTSSQPGTKRTSSQSVTFACPSSAYVTSL